MKTFPIVSQLRNFRERRWRRGREERRLAVDAPFQGDPYRELLEEVADGLNYLAEIEARKGFSIWVIQTIRNHLEQAAYLVMINDSEP